MRRTLLGLGAAACALLLSLAPVQAQLTWGPLGHEMVAEIAQELLTPQAHNALVSLLPESDGRMGPVASWADSHARDSMPWSLPLHYINTEDWACEYEREKDCMNTGVKNFCVDGAIQNFTSQLVAGRAPLGMNVALKFIIHFVGDLHQPLHVGFRGDQGGNFQSGTFDGRPGRKLHQVWDEDIVDKRIREDFGGNNKTYLKYFMDRIQYGDWAPEVAAWRSCPSNDYSPIRACSPTWASESSRLACTTAYVDENGDKIRSGFNLGESYYRFVLPVAEHQIAKGGVRLANVLNAIFSTGGNDDQVNPDRLGLKQRRQRRHRRRTAAEKEAAAKTHGKGL